jgi:hypothetical protein
MVNGIPLNITGWKGVLRIQFEDSTASDSYVVSTGKLWEIREEETVSLEGSLTGYYDTAGTTDSAFTQQIANAYGPYPISLNLTKSLLFASGTCDFEQFTVNVMVPGAKTIDFSADFKFNANPTSMP